MPRSKKQNALTQIKDLVDTVDIESVNVALKSADISSLSLTKKTLMNIAKWVLDGKSWFEIRQNLELSQKEWDFLVLNCPALVQVMSHSQAYAEMVLGATAYQVAIGGKIIKRKMPMKIKDYVDGKVVGEHIEVVEYDETMPPNPYMLKIMLEKKLVENFGTKQKDTTKEMRNVVDTLSEDEIKAIDGEL